MLKKASKRLVWSIIALVASVLLCIGVCLAWFAMNGEVYGEGLKTNLRGKDILKLTVTAYYLDENAATEGSTAQNFSVVSGNNDNIVNGSGQKVTIDQNNNGEINETTGSNKDVMRPYSVDNKYSTAVLYKIEYVLSKDAEAGKKFRIFAECDTTSRIAVQKDTTVTDGFTSSLSNAVYFVNATEKTSGSNFVYEPITGTDEAFTNTNHEKNFRVNFYEGITNTGSTEITDTDDEFFGNYKGTKYVIMDYDSVSFAHLSTLMLENGGSLSSGLKLNGDITLGMEEYDTEETAVPVLLEVEKNGATTQSIGNDTLSHKWQFVVTYSNGTKKIIVSANSGLSSNDKQGVNLVTSTAGNKTVTVNYTEGTTTVSCENITYSVDPVIYGGTGVAKNDTLQLYVLTDNNNSGAVATGVTWSVDNTNLATINSSGVLTGVSAGKVTVTASGTLQDGMSYEITTEIQVVGEKVLVTGITLDKTTATVAVGEEIIIYATVQPSNATNKDVVWTSADESIAVASNESNKDGKIRGVKAGESVTVTATAADGSGVTATCTVTVTAPPVAVSSVTLNKETIELIVGQTETLTADVQPTDASNKTVTWSTGNKNVATVVNGEVTAVGVGTATITVKTNDGNKTDTCTVTVNPIRVTSVTISGGTQVGVNQNLTLSAKVEPDNATDKSVTWESSDETIATVVNGVVTGVKEGNVTITATADGKSDTHTVEVKAATTPTDYTAYGTYNLNIAGKADSDIFTTKKASASSDSGYQGSGNNVYFKVSSGDYVYINMRLHAGTVIHITGNANTSGKASSLKVVDGNGSYTGSLPKGAVEKYPTQLEVDSGTTYKPIDFTLEVKTEGIIVLGLTRGTTASTGCLIRELHVTISDSGTPVEPTPGHTHSAQKHNAVAATCTEVGYEEYYTCSTAGCEDKYYSDSACTQEITLADVTVAAKGHTDGDNNNVCDTCGATISSDTTATTYIINAANKESNAANGLTIKGESYSSVTISYNNITCNNAVKMESGTEITLTIASAKKVTFVTDTANKGILINGTKYTTDGNKILTIDLGAGTHTIKKGDSIKLGLIIVADA